VPDNSIKLTVPPSCTSCGAFGTVKLETSIKGASVTLMWHCTRCDHHWPVKAESVTV